MLSLRVRAGPGRRQYLPVSQLLQIVKQYLNRSGGDASRWGVWTGSSARACRTSRERQSDSVQAKHTHSLQRHARWTLVGLRLATRTWLARVHSPKVTCMRCSDGSKVVLSREGFQTTTASELHAKGRSKRATERRRPSPRAEYGIGVWAQGDEARWWG